jgi:hypothetical protein
VLAGKINAHATVSLLWDAKYDDGGKLVLTEKATTLNGTSPGVSTVVITASDGAAVASHSTNIDGSGKVFTVLKSDGEITETAPWFGGVMGVDDLDFTAYDVVAVFLDNSPISTTALPNLAGATSAQNGNLTATALAYNALDNDGGDRYITLKQVNKDGGKVAGDGVYEIRLWQDDTGTSSAGTADAYTTSPKDKPLDLIGIVDFGVALDPTLFGTGSSGFDVFF